MDKQCTASVIVSLSKPTRACNLEELMYGEDSKAIR